MKFRKKPVVIEATRWFKNGDHPLDGDKRFPEKKSPKGLTGGPDDPRYSGEFAGRLYEGKVVRYFRRPDVNGGTICRHCNLIRHDHGWIDTLEGGHIVCPGDWIITGVKGENYACKPDIFEATYEVVDE